MFPVLFEARATWFILVPVVVLQAGLTFWLWLFALILLDENFQPNWRHWSLLAGKIVLTLIWASPRRRLWVPVSPDEEFVWRALVPIALSLGFVLAAVVAAAHRLEDELAEDRRSMRRLVVFWSGGAFVAGAGITLALRGPMLTRVADWIIVVLALGAVVSLHVWLVRNGGVAPTEESDAPAGGSAARMDPELRQLAGRIESLFQDDHYYATEGLTVAELAARLAERDYKVRRAINGVLGYRNFNAFLNQYRVAAAKRRLLAEPGLPVLRLAMDLGYRSLAGFNKAFKEDTGRTPTEFRRNSIDTNHEPAAQNPD